MRISLGEAVRDPGAPRGAVSTRVPPSPHTYEAVGRSVYSDEFSRRAKVEDVPTSSLRSTQDWVMPKWRPERSRDSDTPEGVRTEDGSVHVFDGHHRANHALKTGADLLKMRVADFRGSEIK